MDTNLLALVLAPGKTRHAPLPPQVERQLIRQARLNDAVARDIQRDLLLRYAPAIKAAMYRHRRRMLMGGHGYEADEEVLSIMLSRFFDLLYTMDLGEDAPTLRERIRPALDDASLTEWAARYPLTVASDLEDSRRSYVRDYVGIMGRIEGGGEEVEQVLASYHVTPATYHAMHAALQPALTLGLHEEDISDEAVEAEFNAVEDHIIATAAIELLEPAEWAVVSRTYGLEGETMPAWRIGELLGIATSVVHRVRANALEKMRRQLGVVIG